jgi:hypothetical protein
MTSNERQTLAREIVVLDADADRDPQVVEQVATLVNVVYASAESGLGPRGAGVYVHDVPGRTDTGGRASAALPW